MPNSGLEHPHLHLAYHTDTYPAHHFEDKDQQNLTVAMGMWSFLITEILFIGALFTAFFIYRMKFPVTFGHFASKLEWPIGCLNTAVLLTSSLTMVLSVHYARICDRKRLVRMLIVTMVLGAAFVGIKSYEYAAEYHHELIPGLKWSDSHVNDKGEVEHRPPEYKLYMTFYFTMTGLHALHMIAGLGVMIVLTYFAWKGKYTAGDGYFNPVEMTGLYWHFVDLVWVFLFPTLYLLRH